MKLTNSYCEGIDKSRTHIQNRCPTCGLWTVWTSKKTGECTIDCNCKPSSAPSELGTNEAAELPNPAAVDGKRTIPHPLEYVAHCRRCGFDMTSDGFLKCPRCGGKL